MTHARLKGIDDLSQWMLTTSTDPYIHHCIIYGLQVGNGFSPHALTPDTLRAAQAQDQIGLMNTFLARVAHEWETLQGQFYISIRSRRSARVWASGLASHLFNICHTSWLARNSIVHDRALRGATIHEHTQLIDTIREQFDLGETNLLSADLHLIQSRSFAQVTALPAPQQRIWIQSILWARQHGASSQAAEATSMSHLMRTWLQSS